MVKKFENGNQTVYQCELCDVGYAELETAERCEQHCSTHESCSIEITRRAIYKPGVQFTPSS